MKVPKSCLMSAIAVERRLHVNEPNADRRCAYSERLIFSTVTRCYGKRVTVFAVAIAAGDSVNYQSFVYGSFVWEIPEIKAHYNLAARLCCNHRSKTSQ